MPTLPQIFRGYRYTDQKPDQCIHVDAIEEHPYVRRCPNKKREGVGVCNQHAKTITYRAANGIQTAYFNSVAQAERFRIVEASTTWIETNYVIPELKHIDPYGRA